MNKIRLQTGFLILIIILVALSRFLPHMLNFSPLAAIGLFGAAHFAKKWQAYLIPLMAALISDIILTNVIYHHIYPEFTLLYKGFYWQYAAYILIILLGAYIYKKNITIFKVFSGVLASSAIFYLISNFGVWASMPMYPKTLSGLLTCYSAGLPFIKGTILGDLFYSSLLFGGYYLLQRRYSFFKLSYQRYG